MYDNSKRIEEGYVVSAARFAQSKNMSFRNLVFRRGITPTDIDLSLDFNDNLYFEGEGKLEGKEIDIGQKRHLQGKSRRIFLGGAESFVILFEHKVTDTNELIYIDDCLVTEIFSGRDNEWNPPKNPITVLKCIKQIVKHCEVKLKIKL